jgi:hypothetical protein
MAKARVAAVKKKAPAAAKRHKDAVVSKKRFKASSGKYAEVAVLDANTGTFGTDLLRVFRENVAKARKENIRLFGSPDRVPDDK